MVPQIKKGDPYHVAKALGDKLVLDANGKNGIRTCTIRPTALYGEGDGQMVSYFLHQYLHLVSGALRRGATPTRRRLITRGAYSSSILEMYA